MEGTEAEALVLTWLHLVFDQGDLATAWLRTDPPFRLSTAQGWIMLNDDLPDVASEDRDELAAALAAERPEHPLWPVFSGWRVVRWRAVLPELTTAEGRSVVRLDGGQMVLAPDLEFVLLTKAAEHRTFRAGEGFLVSRFVVRHTPDGARLAGIGSCLPVPGWPPSEVELPT